MKTIVINGVSCTLSEATIAQYERECDEIRYERETRAWLADPANRNLPEWSDVFKDLYGFRPRSDW